MWWSSLRGLIGIRTRQFLALGLVVTACARQAAGTSTTGTSTTGTPTTGTPGTTTTGLSATTTSIAGTATSEEVAVAFFEAWQAGDRSAMEALAEPEALTQADDLADLVGEAWQFDHCEGAAGTIFCVWASETDQLAIGIVNIQEPHLVSSVSLVDV